MGRKYLGPRNERQTDRRKNRGKLSTREEAMILQLKAVGYSADEICAILQRYPNEVQRILSEFSGLFKFIDMSVGYSGNFRVQMLTGIELSLIKSMGEYLSKTPTLAVNLGHLASAFHRIHDARRLAEGHATKIVESVRHTTTEIIDAIAVGGSTAVTSPSDVMPYKKPYRASSVKETSAAILAEAERVLARAVVDRLATSNDAPPLLYDDDVRQAVAAVPPTPPPPLPPQPGVGGDDAGGSDA